MSLISISGIEAIWYVFFISAALLLMICIGFFVLHILSNKEDKANKIQDSDDFEEPLSE